MEFCKLAAISLKSVFPRVSYFTRGICEDSPTKNLNMMHYFSKRRIQRSRDEAELQPVADY